MIIKTDLENCYFIYNANKSKKFIESPDTDITLIYINDGVRKELEVSLDSRSNLIVAKDDNNMYIVDDGYRNQMIRCGYIVYKDYDTQKVSDKVLGNQIKDLLSDFINKALENYPGIVKSDNKSNIYYLEKDGYRYTIGIYSNFDIVKKNEERKINGLQYYQFDKNMDNFGTSYITIHSLKLDEDSEDFTVSVADDILKNIIANSKDIKFVSMNISNPLYYIKGSREE